MTSFNSGAQPQNRAPQSIGFLLLDNFTLISLASAVEPLRMANQLSGRELYRWTTPVSYTHLTLPTKRIV
mgnify:CR=1 FL=1